VPAHAVPGRRPYLSGNQPTFHRARRPVDEELNDLIDTLSRRIAIGTHSGRKALTLYSIPPSDELPNNPLLAKGGPCTVTNNRFAMARPMSS
jgi:hypothetical protein